jgi:hypothetical protein
VASPNGKTSPKSYGGYAWAEESLLPSGTSPLIISDDDDLISVSELFARADPDPPPAAVTATPAAGTRKRQISEAVPQEELPNGPETTSAAPQQQASRAGGKRGGVQETVTPVTVIRSAASANPE